MNLKLFAVLVMGVLMLATSIMTVVVMAYAFFQQRKDRPEMRRQLEAEVRAMEAERGHPVAVNCRLRFRAHRWDGRMCTVCGATRSVHSHKRPI